jgi:hypothetical protein
MPSPSSSPAPENNHLAESLAAQLRGLGARAHQVRAATRAADHYLAQGAGGERDTGNWLLASAVGLAQDLAADLDGLARLLKERQADGALLQRLLPLRARAHQLHAAARAADRFLEQDSGEDQETGGWLVPLAQTLASKLAAELDDTLVAARRPGAGAKPGAAEPHDPALARRINAATAPLRGAA